MDNLYSGAATAQHHATSYQLFYVQSKVICGDRPPTISQDIWSKHCRKAPTYTQQLHRRPEPIWCYLFFMWQPDNL